MSDRRALVTGATGFVGTALVRRLAADGWTVDALVRRDDHQLPEGVTARRIPGEIDALMSLVAELAPSHCFHLATAFRGVHTPTDIAPMIEANLGFGTALAEAVVRVPDARFVNTGTVWQHYDAAPYSPVSLYAATKQAFADLLTFYAEVEGLAVHTLELTDTYGPDDPRAKLIPFLLQAGADGTPLQMTDGTQLIDLVHVDDAVGALLATAAAPPGPTFGARGDGAITLRELVDRFQSATGLTLDVEWGARASRPREMLRPWMTADPPPGWSPSVRLDDGLRALVS
ncbi:MAG: NAD(P)-dependent oxidoreductase [Acidimicrobiia bacterium]|nr:NAD(P)-dependent oxidoreductase [Acidimicrobiia bacterium]